MANDPNAAVQQAMMLGGMYGPNPYSQFPQGIQGTSYNTAGGGPTDAMGNPIAQPPGMTLNQTVAQPQAPVAAPQSGGLSFAGLAPPSPGGPSTQAQFAYNLGLGGIGPSSSYNPSSAQGQTWQASQHPMATALNGGQNPSASGGAAPNSYQNALNLLSNPGKPNVVGATVPENPSINNQPSVLNQFLAGGNQGGTGAGGYSNTEFFDTLNRLKGMSQ